MLAIKQTLYRTSGDSPIVQALARAAEAGKQVTVIVELMARFDEQSNIKWARALEQSGAHVIYGIRGYKTHAKICLVVRRGPQGIERYVHMGTGNYNEKTARIYTDFGLMTADRAIGEDASAFFNALTGFSDPPRMKKLAMAPTTLRERFLRLIQREQRRAEEGQPAEIRAKMNSLVDEEMIRALYDASKAGVKIRLNVRGICCLRPGVKGVSETIEVVSVVDRFLEHSRVFHFRNGGEDEVYLASADWMPRNLDRRIELLFPVRAREPQEGPRHARRDVPGQRQGPAAAGGRHLPPPQVPARRGALPRPGPSLPADPARAGARARGGRGDPGAHEPGRRRRLREGRRERQRHLSPPALLRLEHQEVLVGQEGLLAGQGEAGRLGFLQEHLARDAMVEGRPHRSRAAVIVDVDEAAARLERAAEALQVPGAVGEVMVGVHDEDDVADPGRQQGVVGEGEHGASDPSASPR